VFHRDFHLLLKRACAYRACRRHDRAARRHAELGGRHGLEGVLADLRARDARDASRDAAPMVAAPDALLLDTTDLSIDAAVAAAIVYVKSRHRPGGT
jgi:cytidylate kinase